MKTLMQRLKDGDEIWVRNAVHKVLKDAPPGNVPIFLGKDARAKVIPPGAAPVCLSDEVPYKYLKESADLHSLVAKGALELVDPEEAKKLYQSNPAKKAEVSRKVRALMESAARTDVAEGLVDKPKAATITPRVMGMVESLTQVIRRQDKAAQDKLVAETLEQLMMLEEVLTDQDLAYLSSSGRAKAIKDWARGVAEARNTEQAEKIIAAREAASVTEAEVAETLEESLPLLGKVRKPKAK